MYLTAQQFVVGLTCRGQVTVLHQILFGCRGQQIQDAVRRTNIKADKSIPEFADKLAIPPIFKKRSYPGNKSLSPIGTMGAP